ncbi:MAG: hypothetical protein ACR65U_14430 [Methylocystis sp.]
MGLLDGGLQAVFGAVLGAVYRDGTLRKATVTPDGLGGYSTSYVDHPIKIQPDIDSSAARAAMGIPLDGGKFIILLAGLGVRPDFDDLIVAPATAATPAIAERIVKTQGDPANAAMIVWTVPAP